jgi:hypothetical protein
MPGGVREGDLKPRYPVTLGRALNEKIKACSAKQVDAKHCLGDKLFVERIKERIGVRSKGCKTAENRTTRYGRRRILS